MEHQAEHGADRRTFITRAGAVAGVAWTAPAVTGVARSVGQTSAPPDPPSCGPDWVEVYRNEFVTSIGPEWSSTVRTPVIATSPNGTKFLGADATPGSREHFGPEIVSLSLVAPPSTCTLRVSFDFHRIASWDGSAYDPGDSVEVRLGGVSPATLVQRTSFAHAPATANRQSYPDPAGVGPVHPSTTGEDPGVLGFGDAGPYGPFWGDGRYRFDDATVDNVSTLTVPHLPGALQIDFDVILDQRDVLWPDGIVDECWGLGNVLVEVQTSG